MIQEGRMSVFLFAHQDDECGVMHSIKTEVESGVRVKCVYFTSGTPSGWNSTARDLESRSVLLQLGVDKSDIHFLGGENKTPDGKLIEFMPIYIDWLVNYFANSNFVISKIFLPAWEGGHPDHDALHIIGVLASKSVKLLASTFQFPLYNRINCIGPFFRVMLPLKANGVRLSQAIPWIDRIYFLRLCLSYPTQFKTWIGLFPFFLYHYFFVGAQFIQGVSYERLFQRPHSGTLYYEKRRFSEYSLVKEKLLSLSKFY
jgi:hypothetical protein